MWDIATRIFPWGAGEDDGANIRQKVTLEDLYTGAGTTAVYNTRADNVKIKAGLRGVETTLGSGSVRYENHLTYTNITKLVVASSSGFAVGDLVFVGDKSQFSNLPPIELAGAGNDLVVIDISGTSVWLSNSIYNLTDYSAGDDVVTLPQFYIEDVTEYASDPREVQMIFSEIELASKSLTNVMIDNRWYNAALALYDRAYAYLQDHKQARSTYSFTVVNVPDSLRVGDTAHFIYRGNVTRDGGAAVNWIDVDGDYYVLKITRNFEADGKTSASLTLSNVASRRSADRQMMQRLSGDMNILKVIN